MRYFLGFLIAIGLLALVIILVVKNLGSNNTTGPQPKPLSSYANTEAIAGILVNGPIVSDQNHQEIQISISQVSSQISIINGYQGTVVNTKIYANNLSAYSAFLSALQGLGFASGNTSYKYKTPAGFCPYGDTYTYSLTNGNDTILNYWATSCGKQGNFNGVVASVNQLFALQIPDYSEIISTTSF
ncbi:MAG TPA: hypothetical protein VII94_01590 [Candidatus Saccharimonadales bacterium]